MKLSDLQCLIHQLGPATPEIVAIVQECIDSWMIEFDEGVTMQIAWDERSGRTLMRCAIGKPEDSMREAVYRSLLNANLLLTSVADVRLALGDADDDVILIGEYDIGDESVDGLRNCLSQFLSFAEKFSQMMADFGAGDLHTDLQQVVAMHHDHA